MRTDELISGFNTPIVVYVLGKNIDTLLAKAEFSTGYGLRPAGSRRARE